jgi:hypothetical protein
MAKFGFGNVMNALAGNISEAPLEKLESEYSGYLFDNEQITMGYKLVRDVIIFTNYRIIFVDKQGATGKKTSFKSIYLFNIIDVEMETAGIGFDDSEVTITYLVNVNRRTRQEVMESRKFEFPKSTDILPLYRYLGNLVIQNRRDINETI